MNSKLKMVTFNHIMCMQRHHTYVNQQNLNYCMMLLIYSMFVPQSHKWDQSHTMFVLTGKVNIRNKFNMYALSGLRHIVSLFSCLAVYQADNYLWFTAIRCPVKSLQAYVAGLNGALNFTYRGLYRRKLQVFSLYLKPKRAENVLTWVIFK